MKSVDIDILFHLVQEMDRSWRRHAPEERARFIENALQKRAKKHLSRSKTLYAIDFGGAKGRHWSVVDLSTINPNVRGFFGANARFAACGCSRGYGKESEIKATLEDITCPRCQQLLRAAGAGDKTKSPPWFKKGKPGASSHAASKR